MSRAVIFDMDGVLVHTTPLHLRVWQEWFDSVDYDPGPGGIPGVMGRRGEDVLVDVLGPDHDAAAAEAIVAGLYDRLLELLVHEPLPLAPGAAQLLSGLADAGVPVALATSGRRDAVEALLDGLLERFAAVVTAENVERGKPDPEVYVTTAARLGVTPDACTVVEDAVAGVSAARAAGMRVVAVTSTAPRAALTAAGAGLVVDDLAELDADLLQRGVLRPDAARARPVARPPGGGRSTAPREGT